MSKKHTDRTSVKLRKREENIAKTVKEDCHSKLVAGICMMRVLIHNQLPLLLDEYDRVKFLHTDRFIEMLSSTYSKFSHLPCIRNFATCYKTFNGYLYVILNIFENAMCIRGRNAYEGSEKKKYKILTRKKNPCYQVKRAQELDSFSPPIFATLYQRNKV